MNQQVFRSSPYRPRDYLNTQQPQNNQNLLGASPNHHPQTHKQQVVDVKMYTLNDYKFIKQSPPSHNDQLPPKALPFQRSKRNKSREASFRDKSTSNLSNRGQEKISDQVKESRQRTESLSRVTDLKKRINQEVAEKQKWKQASLLNSQKVTKLSAELTKLKQHNKWLQEEIQRMSKEHSQSQNELIKANQAIESLSKTINYNIIQLNSLKQKEQEIETVKTQNKSLAFQNESLSQSIQALKQQIQKKSLSSFQQESIKKSQTIVMLQREVEKLSEELKDKVKTQKLLEENIREIEKLLYQRQSELKKIAIHLNFMGRKQAMSIDDVKVRKDMQIKIMRDKYNKVSKDLKELRESKDKVDRNEKKKVSKEKETIRKIKSQKQLRVTSESEQFTFQLSSET